MFIEACICCIWSCSLRHIACIWRVFQQAVSLVYSEACLDRRVVLLILPCMKCVEQCWQLKYVLSLSVSVTVCLEQGSSV